MSRVGLDSWQLLSRLDLSFPPFFIFFSLWNIVPCRTVDFIYAIDESTTPTSCLFPSVCFLDRLHLLHIAFASSTLLALLFHCRSPHICSLAIFLYQGHYHPWHASRMSHIIVFFSGMTTCIPFTYLLFCFLVIYMVHLGVIIVLYRRYGKLYFAGRFSSAYRFDWSLKSR